MSTADQHDLRELFGQFLRAIDDVDEHLRIVHETAWGQGARWEGTRLRLRREDRECLEEEIGLVLDACNRLRTLAPEVAAHVIPPPGETGAQWVLDTLAIADEAYRLANEEYRRCNIYRGPMDPNLVVENYDDREWREQFKDALRRIEEDYQRVRSGLAKALQYLDRVMSVMTPLTADTVLPTKRTADTKTDKQKQIQPDSADVRDLCHLLERELPAGRAQIDIAREFTNKNEKKAQSLLRQARRFRHLWKRPDS